MTFKEAAEAFISDRETSCANPKTGPHSGGPALTQYAYDTIGHLPARQITRDDVLAILKPIWREKTETATRVRSRIENIWDWAVPIEQRTTMNPAAWLVLLKLILPARSQVNQRRHFAAMDHHEAPKFYQQIVKDRCTSSRALQLVMLTGLRSQSVRGADTRELSDGIWTVPPERMKNRKEFRVPPVRPRWRSSRRPVRDCCSQSKTRTAPGKISCRISQTTACDNI